MKTLFFLLVQTPILLASIGAPGSVAWPGHIATHADLPVAADHASTTLSGAITNSATTMTVASGTAFVVNQIILINDSGSPEEVKITAKSGNTLTVTRGLAGTSGASHASGVPVLGMILSVYWNQWIAELLAFENDKVSGPATLSDLYYLTDFADTRLSSSVNSTALSLPVTSGSAFAANGLVTIEKEQIKICSAGSTTLTVCSGGRAVAGTTAVTHAKNAPARELISATLFRRWAAELASVESKLYYDYADGSAPVDLAWPQTAVAATQLLSSCTSSVTAACYNHFANELIAVETSVHAGKITHSSGGGGGSATPDPGAVALSTISGCATAGTGGNDTACIQNAINQSPSAQVTIPARTFNVNPLTMVTGTNIYLDSGATIFATSGFSGGAILISGSGVSNVKIKGADAATSIFKMRKGEYTDGSEYRHCMALTSVSTAVVNGISCNDSGGDGFYISGNSTNITIQNSIANNNSRDAMSVISVNGLLVDNVTLSNTVGNPGGGSAPGGPYDGIDFEPNVSSDHLQNITIQNSFLINNGRNCSPTSGNQNCRALGTGGNGIALLTSNLSAGSGPVSITINNVQSSGNLGSAYHFSNNPQSSTVSGSVNLTNSTSTNDGQYGICLYFYDYLSGGVTLSATGVTITNPQRSYNGTLVESAAIGSPAGGGDSNAFGNITLSGINVNYSGTYAFSINPFSSGGFRALHVTMGTTSGLTGPTLGNYNGSNVNSISVP